MIETLSDILDAFWLNYYMNKLSYSLTEPMKELQAVEAIILKSKDKKKDEAHFSMNSTSTFEA